jgi:oligoribonuclease (3'-5' exoribonuclease)
VAIPPRLKLSPWHLENLGHVLERCRAPGAVKARELDDRIGRYIDRVAGPVPRTVTMRPVLAGNSVHADLMIARRILPQLLRRIHYRILDVTTFKLEWKNHFRGGDFEKKTLTELRRYFPGCSIPDDGRPHDAYYDVNASIAELAFYRSQLARRKRPRRKAG